MTPDWHKPTKALLRTGEVTPALLEEGLARARAAAPDSCQGVFGPESLTWHYQREALNFLGAGRAMVLQTAHPWVAAAVARAPGTMMRPWSRFQRTFIIMFSLAFGSLEQVEAKARMFHALHAPVKGKMSESVGLFAKGSPYSANDIEAMVWVHATLIETSVMMQEMIFGPTAPDTREAFYAEAGRFAWLYGLPEEALPTDWAAFERYMAEMQASGILAAGDDGRHVVNTLLRGTGDRPRPKVPYWFYALTVESLPEPVRAMFGMPLGEREARVAARWQERLRYWYPRLPAWLRHVPPYREAVGRVKGRARADLSTRMMNRLWIGRGTLVS